MADDRDPSERTELAGDRTLLADERTLAAWWRTAMSALAVALGFVGLFGEVEPPWLIRGGATALVLLAVAILVLALRRYRRSARRLDAANVHRASSAWLWIATLLLALAALAIGVAVWLV